MNKETFITQMEFIVKEVNRSHELAGDIWIMPVPRKSLLFAITECAEVIDAILRLDNSFMRNNDKGSDEIKIWQELIDVVIMLTKSQLSEEERYQKWNAPTDYNFVNGKIKKDNLLPLVERAVCMISSYLSQLVANLTMADRDFNLIQNDSVYRLLNQTETEAYNDQIMQCFVIIFELFYLQDVTDFNTELTGKIDRTIAKAAKVREERKNATN